MKEYLHPQFKLKPFNQFEQYKPLLSQVEINEWILQTKFKINISSNLIILIKWLIKLFVMVIGMESDVLDVTC